MRKLINCYELVTSPENLWNAWLAYRRGKRSRRAVIGFEANLEDNLLNLRNDLLLGHYQHGGYRTFLVRDPKRRVISAPSVSDHIVHQAVHNILYEFYDRTFCFASFSCRDKKGLHLALKFIRRYLNQFRGRKCWVLHGDIQKCFDSINHRILKIIIAERIRCERTLSLLDEIINSYEMGSSVGDKDAHGIPLGNLTSQLFINVYLDALDKYIKEKLRIKRYLRYADDFYIFFDSQKDCFLVSDKIRDFLKNELSLNFPLDHQQINNSRLGVPALGQVFFIEYVKTSSKTFRRMAKKFGGWLEDYRDTKVGVKTLNDSWQSIKGALDKGNNFRYKARLLERLICYER